MKDWMAEGGHCKSTSCLLALPFTWCFNSLLTTRQAAVHQDSHTYSFLLCLLHHFIISLMEMLLTAYTRTAQVQSENCSSSVKRFYQVSTRHSTVWYNQQLHHVLGLAQHWCHYFSFPDNSTSVIKRQRINASRQRKPVGTFSVLQIIKWKGVKCC